MFTTMTERRFEEPTARERFTLFIKILFKFLKKSEDELLCEQAKLIVLTYTRGGRKSNIMGDIQEALRDLVGDSTWNKAAVYTKIFLQRRNMTRKHKSVQCKNGTLPCQTTLDVDLYSLIESVQRKNGTLPCQTTLDVGLYSLIATSLGCEPTPIASNVKRSEFMI